MKRKRYFHFLIYRLLFSILTGVLLFGTIFAYLKDKYNAALNQGFERLTSQYERMILYHYQHRVDDLYVNIMCNFYQADYIRMARVRDDGAFVPIYESILQMMRICSHWLKRQLNLIPLRTVWSTENAATYGT